ncbi:FISUMP domain-containing protein [Aureispira anguillae]|uniref:Fibrobacter succinogenes major paralogous domain-containing protein n=1 Tax=Aureispira anguillae TaxID=2864201 RepID=A0A915YE59_9BACT|nr:FISUMP domain-containing protein [Aureispira anguillae]BDS11465.1 hypothetical protein AsAng_0021790 [Aureispira anguillae]
MQKLTVLTFILASLVILWTGCEKAPITTQNNGACSTITDSRDGETYSVVKIGDQCWMAENLRYNASGSWLNPSNPSVTYGRLYDWATLMNGSTSSSASPSGVQGICPSGWHLPSDSEWNELEMTLGMSAVDTATLDGSWRGTHGTGMKSTTGWVNAGNGTNDLGFNAFPAGNYYSGYNKIGYRAFFWTATEHTSSTGFARDINTGLGGVSRAGYDKTEGYSCRCIKD